jgi:hypothetical protein
MSHLANRSAPGRRWRGRPLAVTAAMAAALGAGLLSVVANPAVAAPAVPMNNGVYQLELRHTGNVHTGMVIDVPGNSPDPETQLALWPSNDGDNQRFELRDAGGGYYRIVTRQSYYRSGEGGLLCLDVEGASTRALARIVQYPCHGGDNQLWRPIPMSNGTYGLQAKHSSRYLGYAHTDGDLTGRVLIQDTDPAQWYLNASSFWYPSTPVRVKGYWANGSWNDLCPSGWNNRDHPDLPGPYYENIGDRRWKTNINALIEAEYDWESDDADLQIHVTYNWFPVPGEPYEITGQVRFFCDPE